MIPIARTLGVSPTSLYASPHYCGPLARVGDGELLALIKPIIEERRTFRERNTTARLQNLGLGLNHARRHRIMRRERLVP